MQMKLCDMSWNEARQKCAGKTILMPHGSTEEHGYHLPLKTDALIAEKVCAAFQNDKNTAVAPVMAYTALRKTKAFPGTVGPNEKEYSAWLTTIITDLLKLKPKKIVFFLAHDGSTQRKVFRKLAGKFKKLRYLPASVLMDKAQKQGITQKGDGHAGDAETSLMLFFDSKKVKMRKAVEDYWPEGGISKSGIHGNAREASKVKGKLLFKLYVKKLEKIV